MRIATLLTTTAALIATPALAQTTPTTSTTRPTAAPTTAPTATPPAAAQAAPPAAGAPSAPATTTIAAGLATLPDHATLLRLVKTAKLDAQLAGPGPFTLFAPNDAAFGRLPAGTLDTLTAPANLAGLQTILKNHIVAGSLTEAQIRQQIQAGGGRATLNTLSGQPLTASLENNVVLLTDAVGNKSFIDKADLMQTNGVIHATNGISLPKLG